MSAAFTDTPKLVKRHENQCISYHYFDDTTYFALNARFFIAQHASSCSFVVLKLRLNESRASLFAMPNVSSLGEANKNGMHRDKTKIMFE